METLKNTPVLTFNPDTLQYIRKQYDLENLDRLNEAIDILEEWIKKQDHFEVKKFQRDYLERIIVNNKGSVEKSKKKLDKLCTLRTLLPDYFDIFDFKECDFNVFTNALSPKLTPEQYRLHIIKCNGNQFNQKIFYNYFRYIIWVSDYQQVHDYCNGTTFLCDFTDCNIVDYVLNINIVDLRKLTEIIVEGYSMKIKGIHILTNSKAVEALLGLVKQVLSAKLNKRIVVHKGTESLYEYLPKDILPVEYGGTEKSLKVLKDNMLEELKSPEFIKCKKELNKCRTNETYRKADQFNNEYMGMSVDHGRVRNTSSSTGLDYGCDVRLFDNVKKYGKEINKNIRQLDFSRFLFYLNFSR